MFRPVICVSLVLPAFVSFVVEHIGGSHGVVPVRRGDRLDLVVLKWRSHPVFLKWSRGVFSLSSAIRDFAPSVLNLRIVSQLLVLVFSKVLPLPRAPPCRWSIRDWSVLNDLG